MSAVDTVQAYLDAQADFAARVPAAHASVARIRMRGRDRFAQVGFPSSRDEDWKYTNVRPIRDQVFVPAHADAPVLEPSRVAPFAIPHLHGWRAVCVNGRFDEVLSACAELPGGVYVGSLSRAFEAFPARLEAVLGNCAVQDLHGFAALNGAFLHDGVCVMLEPGTVVSEPIELLFLTHANAPDPLLAQPRNVVVAGEGSQATIIERYVSVQAGAEFTNAVTELIAEPGATVTHYKLQEQNPAAFHVGGLCIHQQADSTVHSHNIALGGRLARTDIRASLNAPGARCQMLGLYLVSGRQHVDNFTHVDHVAPHCTSHELYKGVLDDQAHAVFRGRVVVHEDAQHTDAEQQNNNLLLSRDAEVDTKPQLEIYADDVKCSHGATVGQLDDNAVYYLRSRAIDENTAKSLLTYAFAHDIVERFDLPPLRDYLEQVLPRKLLVVPARAAAYR